MSWHIFLISQTTKASIFLGDSASKTVVVCANKIDAVEGSVDSVVDDVEARLWAELHGFPFCETSACTGQGVAELFQVRIRQDDRNDPAYPDLNNSNHITYWPLVTRVEANDMTTQPFL